MLEYLRSRILERDVGSAVREAGFTVEMYIEADLGSSISWTNVTVQSHNLICIRCLDTCDLRRFEQCPSPGSLDGEFPVLQRISHAEYRGKIVSWMLCK